MKNLVRDRRGMSPLYIVIAALVLIASLMGYVLIMKPEFAPLIDSVTNFWNSIRWWIAGFGALIFLWMTGVLKFVAKRVAGA